MPDTYNMGKEARLRMYGECQFPNFCSYCGAKMKEENYNLGFDATSGKEKIGTVLFCPKYKFKVFSHLTFTFNEKGNEIIERY